MKKKIFLQTYQIYLQSTEKSKHRLFGYFTKQLIFLSCRLHTEEDCICLSLSTTICKRRLNTHTIFLNIYPIKQNIPRFNVGLENEVTKNYFSFPFFFAVFTEVSNLITYLDLKHQFRNSI